MDNFLRNESLKENTDNNSKVILEDETLLLILDMQQKLMKSLHLK